MTATAIHQKYLEREAKNPQGYGWSFHYSPEARIEQAGVMVIGLNPGGSQRDNQESWAFEDGLAYLDEPWGVNGGLNPLQVQVAAMIDATGVRPKRIAAANLVPFRSPGWSKLPDREEALAWSLRTLWRPMVPRLSGRLFLCFGYRTGTEIASLLGATQSSSAQSLDWGGKGAVESSTPDGRVVLGLPHLSRYKVFSGSRTAAKEVVAAAAVKSLKPGP